MKVQKEKLASLDRTHTRKKRKYEIGLTGRKKTAPPNSIPNA